MNPVVVIVFSFLSFNTSWTALPGVAWATIVGFLYRYRSILGKVDVNRINDSSVAGGTAAASPLVCGARSRKETFTELQIFSSSRTIFAENCGLISPSGWYRRTGMYYGLSYSCRSKSQRPFFLATSRS